MDKKEYFFQIINKDFGTHIVKLDSLPSESIKICILSVEKNLI